MNDTAMLVIVTFDCDLMEHFDVRSWNEFMRKLVQRGMTPIAWSKGKKPTPLGVSFDFRGWRCECRRMEGIDLTFCDLGEADFTGTNLQGAKIGPCPEACFRDAWLELACFRGDMSGADFTGAGLSEADFQHACYFAGKPPIGLPAEVLATCEAVPDATDQPDGWPPMIVEQTLRVRASVHEAPW